MEVAFAFGGILFGWLLGFGQQAWRDRREGQIAARLLASELGAQRAELAGRRDHLGWDPYRQIHFRVWEAYAPLILRILSVETMASLQQTLLAVEHADAMGAYTLEGRKQLEAAPSNAPAEARIRLDSLVAKSNATATRAASDAIDQIDAVIVPLLMSAYETPLRYAKRRVREIAR